MNFSTAELRKLIKDLTTSEFNELVQDHFPSVNKLFNYGQDRGQQTSLLLEYVDNHREVDKLLGKIEEINPTVYQEFIKEKQNWKILPDPYFENLLNLLLDNQLSDKILKAYRKIYWEFPELNNLGQLNEIKDIVQGLKSLSCSLAIIHFLSALTSYLTWTNEDLARANKLRLMAKFFIEKEKLEINFDDLETKYKQNYQQTSYLIVAIQKLISYPGYYQVEGWFTNEQMIINSEKDYRPLKPSVTAITDEQTMENAYTLEQVKQIINNWIKEVKPYCKNTSALTLEFFLSADLLSQDWNKWIYPIDDPDSDTLEFEFPLHIRCKERYHTCDENQKTVLKNKWKKVQSNISRQFASSNGNCNLKTLKSNLSPNLDHNIVGLKIIQPLINNHRDIHKALIATSTPIAIWLRSEITGINYNQELDQLLEGQLKDLPTRVYEKRRDVNSPIASYISLVWEDINRTLPNCEPL